MSNACLYVRSGLYTCKQTYIGQLCVLQALLQNVLMLCMQSVDAHGEEERENVPPQGTPPSVRKVGLCAQTQACCLAATAANMCSALLL